MRTLNVIRHFFFATALCVSAPLCAELQNSVSLTVPTLYPGDTGDFAVSAQSGPSAAGAGTKTFTYSGLMKYSLGFGEGRYSGTMGSNRYGVPFDNFEIFQSFVSPLFHTTLTTGGTCPVDGTLYRWVGVRFRNKNLTRGMQDPTATSFYAAGRITYSSIATHLLSGVSYIDLAGPTNNAISYYMDANGAGCTSGTFKTISGSATLDPVPFDAYGTIWFGNNLFTYISSGGNPVMMVGAATQTVNAATFSGINKHVFAGIYTSFDWPGVQTRRNIYLYPDAAGTTFTLRESTSDTDPSLYTNLGTLACTSVGSPIGGFCSGTLTLDAVGGTGKAVCTLSTLSQPTLVCAAQRPDYNTAPVSILASVPKQTVLSVSVSPSVAQVATAGSSTTIVATLTNLSGRAITSLANPGGGLDLIAPFSNAGSYAGTGGTCTSSLAGYASCTVNITYNPSVLGTDMQTFRVAYNNGVSTVNATAGVIGTAGLSSIVIDQTQNKYSPGSRQKFTATATYSDGSKQDVSSAVTWTSGSTTKATFDTTGIAQFFRLGSTSLTATLGTSTDSMGIAVVNRTDYFSVLGQPNTTQQTQMAAGRMSYPVSLATGGGKLLIADTMGNRILAYSSMPTTNDVVQSLVLGQPDMSSVVLNNTGLSASTLSLPYGVCTNGTRVAAVDTLNQRILLWNSFPTVTGQTANVVLGQTSMTTRGSGLSASEFSTPRTCAITGSKLIVPDSAHDRVMIWNTWPTANGQSASVVLGQPDFTTHNTGTSSTLMSGPWGVATDGTRLVVTEYDNNRALVWSTFPTVNGQAASFVLGQTNFAGGTCNKGGSVDSQAICHPRGASINGSRLYIADTDNFRVLLWSTLPTVSNQAASIVVGQPDMNTADVGSSIESTGRVNDMVQSGSRLYLLDSGNFRVLGFTAIPTANGAVYDFSLGGASSVLPSSSNLLTPWGIDFDGLRFFASDSDFNRVLIWNTIPTSTNEVASAVVGQADFTSSGYSVTATTLRGPQGVTSDARRMVVADSSNHRVLIWNTIPSTTGTAASIVLGQPDMTSDLANAGGSASASTLYSPRGNPSIIGNKLLVTDFLNNRVLIWNTWPTANGQSADVVLGQASMTTGTSGTSSTKFYQPRATKVVGSKLFVLDQGNRRILAWNSIPTASGTAADFVLGQSDFTTGSLQSVSLASIGSPTAIASDGNRLFVSDQVGNRVMVWNTIPTMTNQPANEVIGQSAVTYGFPNSGTGGDLSGASGDYFYFPSGLATDGLSVFTADASNGRIISTFPSGSYYASLAISDGPTYAFGSVNVNSATTKTFTVTNSGSAAALNLAVGPTLLAAPFYYKDGNYPGTGGTCGTSLAGGATCTLVVSLLPTATGSYGATLRLQYAAGDGGATQTTSIGVTGSVTTSALTISDGATYNFGTVATSATKSFTVTNPGGSRATYMWSGTPVLSAPYSFLGGSYPGTGGTCTTLLEGGATCTFVVSFNPTASGTFNDTVRITYVDGNSATQTITRAVTGTK